MNWGKKRFSDDDIYLNEDRYNNQRQDFELILSIIKEKIKEPEVSILDCGCATGELLYFLQENIINSKLSGFDISEKMIMKAKCKMPNVNYFVQNINTEFQKWKKKPECDIVILSGVLSIFDDFKFILNNLISCTNKLGCIILTIIYNKDPIDVLVRYKRYGSEDWECGWNTPCKESIEDYLKKSQKIKNFEWRDFNPKEDRKKRKDDPMRKWTINLNGEKTNMVGTGQIINQSLLIINLN